MCVELLLLVALVHGDWQPAGTERGFAIEKRPAKGTSLFEVRVSGPVDLAPKQIFDVLWDVRAQKTFAPHIKRLDVVSEAKDSVVIYEQVEVPVVQDRDYTLRLRRLTDDNTQLYQVIAENADSLGPPPDKDHVRMKVIWSNFTIEPGDKGSVVTYHSFGDPAGDIPTWLKNAAATRAPLDFVLAIVKEAKLRQKRSAP
ncbi:MAG: hypothetical protein IT381_14470 [Deltaproteobacteria bacterium]|nr:hypothetical protein [Deltaproteobacteria bacterium]